MTLAQAYLRYRGAVFHAHLPTQLCAVCLLLNLFACSGVGEVLNGEEHFINAEILIWDDGSLSGKISHAVCTLCAMNETEPTDLPLSYYYLAPDSSTPSFSSTPVEPAPGTAEKALSWFNSSSPFDEVQAYSSGKAGPIKNNDTAFQSLKLRPGELICKRQNDPQAPVMPGVASMQPATLPRFWGELICRTAAGPEPRKLASHVVEYTVHDSGAVSYDKLSDAYLASLATSPGSIPAWGAELEKYLQRPGDSEPVALGKDFQHFVVAENGVAVGTNGRSFLLLLPPGEASARVHSFDDAKIGQYDRSTRSQLGINKNGSAGFGLKEEGRMRICAWKPSEERPRCFLITAGDLPD